MTQEVGILPRTELESLLEYKTEQNKLASSYEDRQVFSDTAPLLAHVVERDGQVPISFKSVLESKRPS